MMDLLGSKFIRDLDGGSNGFAIGYENGAKVLPINYGVRSALIEKTCSIKKCILYATGNNAIIL